MHFKHLLLLLAGLNLLPSLYAQPASTATAPAADSTNLAAGTTPEAQLASLQLEMTNAYQRVLQIVNQRVTAYSRTPSLHASVYSPGWFHEGAAKPDFNNVDIRQSQDLHYANEKFVTSDLNPGIVFLGQDLEFNANTKWFYTNRSLPKHKLTEAQMLEVNRLYRIIGRCETAINQLQAPAAAETQPAKTDADGKSEVDTGTIIPGQQFEAIRKIPKQDRILYGGIAIGSLLLIVVVLRLFRRRT
jgi:hypothetical protein